jgi:branched-chain amino acid transport system ATP-binding protein
VSQGVLLRVENLARFFGGIQAVSAVNFELYRGDILGIIGPNGSGKTTLLNLITGFIAKDSGEVIFQGKDISDWPAHKIADAGLVRTFQIVRPYASSSTYKNLIPPLYSPRSKRTLRGKLGDRDAVAMDILEEVGFERDSPVPYKMAGALPLGYLKRLELARCLAMRPDVICCDEVFSGLSMAEIASMVPLMAKLQSNGITIIMIEHRLRELFKIASRLIVMNFGEKIAEGVPEEVMKREEVRRAYLGEEGVV